MEGFVETDLDSGEVVAAAADGNGFAREVGIALCEETGELIGRHGDLGVEMGKLGGDGDGSPAGAGGGKITRGGEAGAGAVRAPFMLEEAGFGIDVAELRGIGAGIVVA